MLSCLADDDFIKSVNDIRSILDSLKTPDVIICGDFNDTPLSYIYRTFAHQRKDSFCEQGIGFGTTYAGNIPALRIDYILTDPIFQIETHEVYRFKVSDHYGVGSAISF